LFYFVFQLQSSTHTLKRVVLFCFSTKTQHTPVQTRISPIPDLDREHMFPRYVPDATPPAQAPATMPCAAFWWVKSVTGSNAVLARRGCVRYISREHMFKRVPCSWCLPNGGPPRGPLPKTARLYRSDTHTSLPSSTQVRYGRNSRLHRCVLSV